MHFGDKVEVTSNGTLNTMPSLLFHRFKILDLIDNIYVNFYYNLHIMQNNVVRAGDDQFIVF